MITQPLSGGQQAKKRAARQALRAGLLVGLFVLAPPRASGQATFSEARPVETPPLHDLAIADLDGDDDPDLVAITAHPVNDEDADALVWFENDGAGLFASAQTLLAGLPREARTLKAADLDGDDDPDLLIGNDALFYPGGLFWAANDGGAFSALEVIEPVESGPFITVDFDDDGDLDVLQGGLYVGLYENTGESGSSRFRRSHALAPGPAGALVATDFDGDGDGDLIASQRSFARNNDLAFTYEQRELGPLRRDFARELMFFSREQVLFNRLITVMETANINGDEKIDVVIGAYVNSDVGPVNGRLEWYKNGSFNAMPVFSIGAFIIYPERDGSGKWGPGTLAAADFDRDGDDDVAITKSANGPDSLVWYENPGEEAGAEATWSEHMVGVGVGIIRALQATDINLDGDIDLVALSGRSSRDHLVWYENLGSTGTTTDDPQHDAALVPESLKLEAVWPNPSSGAVTVAYQVRQAGRVRLEVFDVLGRRVATYEQHPQRAGSYQAEVDLSVLAAGSYVLRLQAERQGVATQRIVLQ